MREISEGRMRADARGGGPVSVPSEGRIRASGQVLQAFGFQDEIAQCSLSFQVGNRGGGGGSVPVPSEGRMRAAGQVVHLAIRFTLWFIVFSGW